MAVTILSGSLLTSARRRLGSTMRQLPARRLPNTKGSLYRGNVAAVRARGLPWCGAEMADELGIYGQQGRELWLARNWARWAPRHRPTSVLWWSGGITSAASSARKTTNGSCGPATTAAVSDRGHGH